MAGVQHPQLEGVVDLADPCPLAGSRNGSGWGGRVENFRILLQKQQFLFNMELLFYIKIHVIM